MVFSEHPGFPKFGKVAGLLLLAGLPVVAQAADFTYTTNLDNTITITAYTGSVAVLDIPAEIDGLPVTVIGEYALSYLDTLTGVIVPNSVTNIADDAFNSCSSLTNVILGNGVAVIGEYAFYDCSSLASITIPSSVSVIGDYAFLFCSSLPAIIVDEASLFYSSVNGVLISEANAKIIQCPEGKTGTVTIPDNIDTIGDYAFYNCSGLTGIYFRGNDPVLGDNVFTGVSAPVYYLPTSGWVATPRYGGLLTVLWNPQIQLGEGFGMGINGFGFTVSASNDFAVAVESCTNLISSEWVTFQTNFLSGGLFYFTDQISHPQRFYRLRMP